ncbi:MAG: hypothetical protein AAGJ93_07320, partial [Bacteroidota bacterium]
MKTALEQNRQEIIHDLHSGLLPEVDSLLELSQRSLKPAHPQLHQQISEVGHELSEDIRSLMWTLTQSDGGTLDKLVGRLRQKVSTRFAGSSTVTAFKTTPTIIPEGINVPFLVSYHLYYF